MSLIVHEVALERILELRTLIPSIARHDARPGAAVAAPRVATCWRCVADEQAQSSLALLDRVLGMLWRLNH